MTVLQFPEPERAGDALPAGQGARESRHEPGAVGRQLERAVATLPSRGRVAASARWWATTGLAGLGVIALKAPLLVLLELRPIAVGAGRIAVGWARWCGVAESEEAIAAAEGSDKAKYDDRRQARKSGRRKLSLAVVVVLVGAALWAWVAYPQVLILAGIVLVGVCDAVGRAGREKSPKLPPPARTVLKEGVPLSQLTAAIVDTLLREGREIGISRPMRYDAARQQYHLEITCLDEITAEHLRAVERGIGADDYTVRCLGTGVATRRELVILDGDPLAHVSPPPWLESGSRTIAEPLDLGESRGDSPMAITFAGVHVAVIGMTGSGKTKGLLWAVIDRLSACRDVVLFGVDLAAGPALPMWRRVFQQVAHTPEDAGRLLDRALAEVDRRMKVLKDIAEDDDPDNDTDEWLSALGPALVLVVDEFALVAEQNGEKGRLDLMSRVEKILRLGRKVWVTLILATQKAGNSDLGSTVAATQIGLKILLACSERDTVMMYGTEARDRGWSPHLLKPATDDEVRDAGKCFISGPAHRSPDVYRSYAPMAPGEVKRRARQRLADGIPSLSGGPAEVVDVAEVPPLLAAVERVFAEAGNPEWMATAELLPLVQAGGFPDLTATQLADGLPIDRKAPGMRRRPTPKDNPVWGYTLASIRKALGEL